MTNQIERLLSRLEQKTRLGQIKWSLSRVPGELERTTSASVGAHLLQLSTTRGLLVLSSGDWLSVEEDLERLRELLCLTELQASPQDELAALIDEVLGQSPSVKRRQPAALA